jgi:hypothetical protein
MNYLRRHDLAERYRCTDRNIDLWVRAGRLPQPTLLYGRTPLWDEAILDKHDRAAKRTFKLKAAAAGSKSEAERVNPKPLARRNAETAEASTP